jgi:hypothetical protein
MTEQPAGDYAKALNARHWIKVIWTGSNSGATCANSSCVAAEGDCVVWAARDRQQPEFGWKTADAGHGGGMNDLLAGCAASRQRSENDNGTNT